MSTWSKEGTTARRCSWKARRAGSGSSPRNARRASGRARLVGDQLLVADAVDRQGKDVHEVFDQPIVLGPRHDQILQSARPLESGAAKLVEARDDLVNGDLGRSRPREHHGTSPRSPAGLVRVRVPCSRSGPRRIQSDRASRRSSSPRRPSHTSVDTVSRHSGQGRPTRCATRAAAKIGSRRSPTPAPRGWLATICSSSEVPLRGRPTTNTGAFVRGTTIRFIASRLAGVDHSMIAAGLPAVGVGVEGRVQQAVAERGGLEGGGGVAKPVACPSEAERDRDPDRRRDPPILEDRRISVPGALVIAGGGIHFGDQPLAPQGAAFELDEIPDARPRVLDPPEPCLAPGSEEDRRARRRGSMVFGIRPRVSIASSSRPAT